ncbi:MAG: hypothetical protein QXQ95_08755 [Thermofilum sp.]|uniref:hypothetical protein n=1 Tax=Thermofilum sp. TaxID=1961369 RepID=UPI00317EA645
MDKNRKTDVIMIRCTRETKKMWQSLLYEYKKAGWDAERLLRYMMNFARTSISSVL